MSHLPISWDRVMHPISSEINREFLEHIGGDEETLVLYMDEPSIHPHKVIGLKRVNCNSLCHKEQFGEENGVVHFKPILYIIFVELMFWDGQVMVHHLFHFRRVPLRLEPTHLLVDEVSVGPCAMLVHESLQILIAKYNDISLSFEHLCEEAKVILKASLHITKGGLNLSALNVPQPSDDGHNWLMIQMSRSQIQEGNEKECCGPID